MDYINSSLLDSQRKEYLESLILSIKEKMPDDLYRHTMGTLKYSKKLALKYIIKDNGSKHDIDTFFKLCVSAVLHDYGKIFKYKDLVDIVKKNNIALDRFEIECRPILHSMIGDFLAARDYNIKDPQILKAIRCHTVGCKNMEINDKILFISDKIEESRYYEGIEHLRKICDQSLDHCLLEVYKNNIIYNLKRNNLLHPHTILIWNNICGGR